MVFKKKRRPTEMVWGPEKPWIEPKREVILGPAGSSQDVEKASQPGETSLGFLSTMAGVNAASESSETSSETDRPKSSPYGWEPGSSSSSSSYSGSYSDSNSMSSSSDPDMTDKIFRLQRKIDALVERIEALERKTSD